jgi:integrase
MATYQQRGKSWRAIVRRVGFDDISDTFNTKAKAEKWARGVEAAIDNGTFVDPRSCRITAFELMERYGAEVVPTHKGWRNETQRLNRLKRTCAWAKMPVNTVTAHHILAWRDRRLKEVSSASVRREMIQLSGMFSHAQKEWLLPVSNPIRSVSKPPDSKPRSRRPSTAELASLRNALTGTSLGALMEIAIETAMRMSEMTELTWDRVDLEARKVVLLDTKNGDPRDVPLSTRAIEVFKEQVPRWTLWRMTKVGQRRGECVFGLTAATAGQRWKQTCDALKIKNLHFHDLRHEATTRMAKKLNHLQLARVTGHKDLKQLQRYYNPEAKDLAEMLG